jgi:hypothetical protein
MINGAISTVKQKYTKQDSLGFSVSTFLILSAIASLNTGINISISEKIEVVNAKRI